MLLEKPVGVFADAALPKVMRQGEGELRAARRGCRGMARELLAATQCHQPDPCQIFRRSCVALFVAVGDSVDRI